MAASVAVVIPTWNGRELLEAALRSLAGQTFREFQVVVVRIDNPTTLLVGETTISNWVAEALFSGLDRILRTIEPLFPKRLRARAIEKAIRFVEERLNGEDGLGAIFPPMANTVMMYEALGFPPEHPPRAVTRRGIDRLLVIREDEAYCQPCVSPIWDTALTCHALLEAGGPEALNDAGKGLDWLLPKQELVLKGDWAVKRPDVRPGGWAFQYANAYYPDLDDTAVVVMAMDRVRRNDRSDQPW